MALLWEYTSGGTHYSVRSAGESIRLYSNNVFHTQWNPRRPFAGGVWDCLSLPALYQTPGNIQSALVLGLGGGAVVRQLQVLLPATRITAVEIDPVHIRVAKQWFGVSDSDIEIIEADAVDWLQSADAAHFDYIVDDLFGHLDSDVKRSRELDLNWVQSLNKRLSKRGILVCNCVSMRELKESLPRYRGLGYSEAFSWQLPNYDNAVGVFLREPAQRHAWLHRLAESKLGAASKKQAQLIKRRRMQLTSNLA